MNFLEFARKYSDEESCKALFKKKLIRGEKTINKLLYLLTD